MNEIQTIKAEKLAEVKKNSKKGFTLIELVVVIAILAILAIIAIPVVSGTIASAQRSTATSNASTLELALKEADAYVSANDKSVYQSDPTISEVVQTKGITSMTNVVTVGSDPYTLVWNTDDGKVYYASADGTTDISGNVTLTPGKLTVIDVEPANGVTEKTASDIVAGKGAAFQAKQSN